MNEPVRPDELRVSDVERGRVQDGLRRAHDAGRVAGPPGAVLGVLYAAGIGRPPRW